VLLLAATACLADTVYLNDGQVFHGTITRETNDHIVIRTDDGYRERIPRYYVREVTRDGGVAYAPVRRWQYAPDYWRDHELLFKLGIDFNGRHTTSHSNLFIEGEGNESVDGSYNTGSGLSFGGEYVQYISPHLGLGGGLTFQSARSLADVPGMFSFLPLYGTVKLRTNPGKGYSYSYLTGQVGYNLFDGDRLYRGGGGELTGGLYWGLGAGVVVRRLQFELLYTVSNGHAKDAGYLYDDQTDSYDYFQQTGDITYSKLGFNVGIKF
jgi:hypothetical protein